MSQQERASWVSLATTLLIGYWYFSRVFALPAASDLHGGAMAGLVLRLIVLAIVIGIAGEVLLNLAQRSMRDGASADATTLDERDALIGLKATRNGHVALFAGVVFVLVQIALIEGIGGWMRGRHRDSPAATTVLEQILTGPLTAMHVAQLLLLVMTLSSLAIYASRIFYYRRGI
jgi:hypothetical protein